MFKRSNLPLKTPSKMGLPMRSLIPPNKIWNQQYLSICKDFFPIFAANDVETASISSSVSGRTRYTVASAILLLHLLSSINSSTAATIDSDDDAQPKIAMDLTERFERAKKHF